MTLLALHPDISLVMLDMMLPDTNGLLVLQQMERENRFELSTLEAAQRCSVSKSYFSRRFKAHFGMTFKEYLLVRKLKSAVGLLLTSDRRVADIAELTGFTDSAYFILKFRTLLGCTPGEFRQQAGDSRRQG